MLPPLWLACPHDPPSPHTPPPPQHQLPNDVFKIPLAHKYDNNDKAPYIVSPNHSPARPNYLPGYLFAPQAELIPYLSMDTTTKIF